MVIKTSNANRLHGNIVRADKAKSASLSRLASGKRIQKGSDDPAGLAMAMGIESQTRGLIQQINSRQSEISLLQTAEGTIASSSDILQRISELSVQASNGTLTDSDRGNIQLEVDQLKQQLNQNAGNAQFNGKKLLDGSMNLSLQGGQTLSLPALDTTALNLDEMSLQSAEGATMAISTSQAAIANLSSLRGNIGSAVNGISSQVSALQTELVNATASRSRIEDADMAAEIINMNLANLQTKFAIKAFKFQDENRATILNLLND